MVRDILCIVGTYDKKGGKPSSVGKTIYRKFVEHLLSIDHDSCLSSDSLNGGSLEDIENRMNSIRKYKYILWMPNISNDIETKWVRNIKKTNPKCLLITSKRNVDNKYSLAQIISHALKIKSNLIVEFNKTNDLYGARIIDPLGNIFTREFESDMESIGTILAERVLKLANFTRIGSRSIGDYDKIEGNDKFIEIVREKAEIFEQLMLEGIQNERFMGNTSFRCEKGFPSFRGDTLLFVSKRDINKKDININNFVPISPDSEDEILFYGNDKPSVDTPIQLRLYKYLPKVDFMIHGHVYVKGAPFTEANVTCGAIQEFDEIKKAIESVGLHPESLTNFAINLIGHGSIVFASDLKYFSKIEYYSRPIPEALSK